jgi:phage gp37-like protein
LNQLRIDEVEDAIVAHLQAALPGIAGHIASLSSEDFDEGGDAIVTDLPAVRVFYRTGALDAKNDQTALTYDARLAFVVMVGASNMRSRDDERKDALKLLGDVANQLAGKRLAGLASRSADASRPTIVLENPGELMESTHRGTWYALPIVVEGKSQYEANSAAA